MADRPTFYILDAYSLIFQVFHAIPEMTGPSGQPTNAAFGVFRDLLNLFRDREPGYVAAAFDGAGPVFRSEIFADYKANRSAMPVDLVPQIAVVRSIFEGFNVPVLIEPGMEADDVIATLARRGEERGLDVFVCTSDKDARQLISDRVRILNIRKNSVMDAEALEKDWGIRPSQVVDFLALTGDAVDNVPGVPGIGPVLAAGYLREFGDLESLLANPDRVKGPKKRQALRDHADVARRARSLVALRDDLPMELDWEALRASPPDVPALRAICVASGFHRFLSELGESKAPEADSAPRVEWAADYSTIDTPESFHAFLEELRGRSVFCIDVETIGRDPLRCGLVGIAVSWKAGEGRYIPLRGPIGHRLLDPETVLEGLRPILADHDVEKVGQNLKFDMLALGRAGADVAGPITDTMILSYLLESGERNHGLDQLSERLLGHAMVPIADLIGKGKKQIRMDQVDVPRVSLYACEDADATWRLYEILAPRVRDEGLWGLYADLERPLIAILAGMEAAGVMIDVPRLKRLSEEYAVRLAAIEEEVHRLAGGPFNVNSVPQLRKVLFEDLKLPRLRKTPGGESSTDTEVLEELAAKHPLPALLVQHRRLAKLKGTYLDALPELVHSDDGRIHASFNQGVAATGRLSSSDPNLQNVPVRTEEGRQIRAAFVAEGPDRVLLTADYSQIELRVLAHYSEDPALRRAFEADGDVHRAVAARIFGVGEDRVDSDMRRVAKTVNFGVIYGLSPFGLAARLGIGQAEAAAFIEAYFQEYRGVDRFIEKTLESAKAAGRVETILGRRRPIVGIKNTAGHVRNLAERLAVNTVIQGSAADLIKRAMILVDRRLRAEGLASRMILQIHDELVFEGPRAETPALARLAREEMTGALALSVPLKVDLAAGPNWLDVEPLDD